MGIKKHYPVATHLETGFLLPAIDDSSSSGRVKEGSRTICVKTRGYDGPVKELCRVNFSEVFTTLGFSSFLIKKK